jgi:hypothetical protein
VNKCGPHLTKLKASPSTPFQLIVFWFFIFFISCFLCLCFSQFNYN